MAEDLDCASAKRHLVEHFGLTAEGAEEVVDLLTNPDRTQDFADSLAETVGAFAQREGLAGPALGPEAARGVLGLFERHDPASRLTLVAVHDLLFGESGPVGVPEMQRLRREAETALGMRPPSPPSRP